MAESATTARPYARAAFASASAQLAQWSTFLNRAAAVVLDPQVEPLIGNPRVASAKLVEFVLELSRDGLDSPQAVQQRNFLHLLADNRRLPLMPEIARQFEQLRAEAEHIANVDIISAQELTPEQSQQLQTALERRLGRRVQLHAKIDRSLIGGAIVRYGDFVVDGSLSSRVERMASAMSGA